MLPNLIEELEGDEKVVIVDNKSEDGSVEVITQFVKDKGFESIIDVVDAGQNGGFSFGNNAAIKHYLANYKDDIQYVLLLNPDTKIKEGAITRLIEFANSNHQVGIVGSGLEDIDGNLQNSAFTFHSILSELSSGFRLGFLDKLLQKYLVAKELKIEAQQVDWVAGASMLIRYEVIRQIGLMDEKYFLYFEETDFCLQATRKGWQTWFLPESRVVHYEGQSTGIVSGDPKRRQRPKYWFESRRYYFLKNHGLFYTVLADLLWGIGFTVLVVRLYLLGREPSYPKNMWIDFWKNSILFSWVSR
jgi:hypothetical protein